MSKTLFAQDEDDDDSWNLDDSTIDDLGMTNELRDFLTISEPAIDPQGKFIGQGGLGCTPKFADWLEGQSVLTLPQLLAFGRKNMTDYFTMTQPLNKVKSFAKYIERVRVLVSLWGNTKSSTESDHTFTTDKFSRSLFKSMYKKSNDMLNKQFIMASENYDVILRTSDKTTDRRLSMEVPTKVHDVDQEEFMYDQREGKGTIDEDSNV